MLLTKARLSSEEAERFLVGTKFGGEDEAEHHLVIAALRKDRAAFEPLYQKLVGPRADPSAVMLYPETSRRIEDSKAVLYAWLRNRLLAVSPPESQPDLMPPNAKPLLIRLRAVVDGRAPH